MEVLGCGSAENLEFWVVFLSSRCFQILQFLLPYRYDEKAINKGYLLTYVEY